MTPQFDGTIHLSDLVLFGGGILAFLKVWLAMRDDVRDHGRDITRLDATVKGHNEKLSDHERALARLGMPAFGSRHDVEGV